MAKRVTVLSLSCDFALAEAVELFALRRNVPRSEALRMLLRQAADPLGEHRERREPLPWVEVTEQNSVALMLDCGPGCWAIIRRRVYAYPVLTIEEPGQPIYRRVLEYSPEEYAIYLAEGIVTQRFPHIAPAPDLPIKTVDGQSRDAGPGYWALDMEAILRAA